MRNFAATTPLAAMMLIGFGGPLSAAQPSINDSAVSATPTAASSYMTAQPAEGCLNDLRAFKAKIDKDGYWLGGAEDGYGYPAGAWGYGYGMGADRSTVGTGYLTERPGYEIRTLLSSANILARQGQQQPCEDVLATTNTIYKQFMDGKQGSDAEMVDGPRWREQQIAAAKPAANDGNLVRSDQLIGTELRNQKDVSLGSIHDIVMSPATGKIAFLIVARGGIFGIDRKYVPVPWADIKATPNMNLLILDSTKSAMDDAPQVKDNRFGKSGNFDQLDQKINDYWKTHLASNTRD